MRYKLLSLLLVVSLHSFSQNCDPATVGQLPGNWKEGISTGSAGYAEASVVAKAKKITEAFHTRIRQNYSPVGLQAKYSFSRIEKEYHLQLYSYHYRLGCHPFYCYKNTITPQVEPIAIIYMKVNPGIFFKGGGLDFLAEKNKLHYGWIEKMPVEKDGIWDYGKIDEINLVVGNTDAKVHKWLITYEGKLPFQYVSRLEFLQGKKINLQQEKQKSIEDIRERILIRSKTEQEKEKAEQLKKFKEEAAKGYGDFTPTYLRNYQTDEQKQEDAIRNTSKYFDDQLSIIEKHLQMPEKELQQPAIMAGFQNFQGFAKEGETGARILVKENPNYYNKKLPAGITQLIVVEFGYDALSPLSTNAFKGVLKTIDFAALKSLLGK